MPATESPPAPKLSEELEAWLRSDTTKTLEALVGVFKERSFAILFVLLLALPALPLPTGGATHVMEIIAGLLALELIAGRRDVWLPRRWRDRELTGARQQRFIGSLMRLVRRLERISRPRITFVFRSRLGNRAFGLLVLVGCAGAFLAPPFTGLDTLPALSVVMLSLAFLLQDALIGAAALIMGAAGIALELAVGGAALHGLSSFFN